jgi:hypothetical protein
VVSRVDVLRRLRAATVHAPTDDDGGRLDDAETDAFVGLPESPQNWDDGASPLDFRLRRNERDFLRRKLGVLARPGDNDLSLLARLVNVGGSFPNTPGLPRGLNDLADPSDRRALQVARDAAALAAIGRAVYGALVEHMRARDGVAEDDTFETLLESHLAAYGDAAAQCDLESAGELLPELPTYVRSVLRETQSYVREGKPHKFLRLLDCYQTSERIRKGRQRARLMDGEYAVRRRAEWRPDRHNTSPLHYRWHIIRAMLSDLST